MPLDLKQIADLAESDITMLGVKAYRLGVDPGRCYDISLVDRDVLSFTPVIAESYDADATRLLRPTLDEMWNAAGLTACGDYDAAGPTRALKALMLMGHS